MEPTCSGLSWSSLQRNRLTPAGGKRIRVGPLRLTIAMRAREVLLEEALDVISSHAVSWESGMHLTVLPGKSAK